MHATGCVRHDDTDRGDQTRTISQISDFDKRDYRQTSLLCAASAGSPDGCVVRAAWSRPQPLSRPLTYLCYRECHPKMGLRWDQ
jgi:hypothetical protein